jgi:hypothetical protein
MLVTYIVCHFYTSPSVEHSWTSLEPFVNRQDYSMKSNYIHKQLARYELHPLKWFGFAHVSWTYCHFTVFWWCCIHARSILIFNAQEFWIFVKNHPNRSWGAWAKETQPWMQKAPMVKKKANRKTLKSSTTPSMNWRRRYIHANVWSNVGCEKLLAIVKNGHFVTSTCD